MVALVNSQLLISLDTYEALELPLLYILLLYIRSADVCLNRSLKICQDSITI